MAIKFLNGIDVVGSMNITADDIPDHSARKITSDTLDAARMPDLSGTYLTTSAKAADSELLDGLDSTSFLYNQVSQLANTDLDALSAQGIYHSGSSYSTNNNIPHANYFILANFTNDNDRQSQLWFGDTPTNFWWRPKQGASTWHPWEKVWTSSSFSSTNISNWNTAYGWGDHSTQGYTGDQDLSGYLLNTTDTFAGNITFNGGNNNSKESFLNVKRGSGAGLWLKFQTDSTSANNVSQFVIRRSTDNVDILSIDVGGNLSVPGTLSASGYNDGNWNTAYGWGNHASAQYATEAWVGEQNYATDDAIGNAISNLISSSPANLDTLNELAAALGDDANFSTTVTNSIATKMPQGQQRTDINALINGGHRYDPSVNLPTNEHHAAITFGNNGNVTGQIATHFQTGELYSRGYNNSWSSWKKAWNDSNFSLTDVQNGVTAHGWGDHAAGGYAQGAFLPLAGGSLTGKLLSPRTSLNRIYNSASGYNYYSDSINTWQTYMAAANQTGVGYNGNLTAPSGTYVTSWAIRSVVEPVAGYGWTWEELANGATTGQSVIAELSSVTGNFKTVGSIYASGGNSTEWNTAYDWGNHAAAGYASGSFLGATAKAADSNLLDGIDSSSFLRSDANDTHSGTLALTNITAAAGSINNTKGSYLHIGSWGVARTAADAVLVNTAYRSDILSYSRNFTIGNTTRSFQGNADVGWTLGEIGAEAAGAAAAVDARIDSEIIPAIPTNNNQLTNGAGYATTSYVNTAVANIIDTAPAALNTLNELAAALGDDANFSTTVTNSIATKLPLAGGTATGTIAAPSFDATTEVTVGPWAIRHNTGTGRLEFVLS